MDIMSERGHDYIGSLITEHGLDPALFAAPVFKEDAISIAPGKSVSLRRSADLPPEFNEDIRLALSGVCLAEVAIAARLDRTCSSPYDQPNAQYKEWRINGATIRDALRPSGIITGTLDSFYLQTIDPADLAPSTARNLFRIQAISRSAVEGSTIALAMSARHLGKVVSCALGIQIRDLQLPSMSEPETYIAGRTSSIAANLRGARDEARLRMALADVRAQELRLEQSRLPGSFESNQR
jgi:hypothetical protein